MKTFRVWQALVALTIVSLVFVLFARFVTTTDAASATRFVSPSGSGASCSRATPCTMSTALGASNNGDAIYFASGILTGTGAAVITLTKSITLCGGWDGTTAFPVVRNPALYQSQLDGQMRRRVI